MTYARIVIEIEVDSVDSIGIDKVQKMLEDELGSFIKRWGVEDMDFDDLSYRELIDHTHAVRKNRGMHNMKNRYCPHCKEKTAHESDGYGGLICSICGWTVVSADRPDRPLLSGPFD